MSRLYFYAANAALMDAKVEPADVITLFEECLPVSQMVYTEERGFKRGDAGKLYLRVIELAGLVQKRYLRQLNKS